MLMKQSKTRDYRKFYVICFITVVLLILLGLVISLKSTGGLFSKASLSVRNMSFNKTTFSRAMAKSFRTHILYSILVLVLSGNPAGLALSGAYIGFKAFSTGALIGLAVKSCTLKKALTICFCAFVSNVFVFPLYAMLYIISVKYYIGIHSDNSCLGNVLTDYFSYAARVFIMFALLCISDCIQNAVGIFVISLLG